MDKTTQKLKEEFEQIFNFGTVFHTDNFEEPKMIDSPHYNEGRLFKELWSWFSSKLSSALKEQRKEFTAEKEKAVGEVVEKIKKIGIPEDPTMSNKEWKQTQIYKIGFNRAKEIIIYILTSKDHKGEREGVGNEKTY